MEQLDLLAGTYFDDACTEAYEKAVHGKSVMFRFNGVQVIMFRDVDFPVQDVKTVIP